MLKRLTVSAGGATSLAVLLGMLAFTEAETKALDPPQCQVTNTTHAWNYGSPPTYLGGRNDYSSWTHYMTQNECTDNLAQPQVQLWGAQLCAFYGAEYVTLTWQWEYTDNNYHYGNLHQQYDCDDL